jgi:signal peptidase I
MLQFLRFNAEQMESTNFTIIGGSAAFRFFSVRALKLVVLLYSTIFLAVAIPFVWTYFIGGMLSFIYFMRIVNHAVKYLQYREGGISVDREKIDVTGRGKTFRIKPESLTYLEVNVFGNLIIREKYHSTSFPVLLLGDEERARLLALFQDMSPNRTRLFRKTWEVFDAILVAFILAMHIRQFIIQAYFIPTGSMEDTLQVGDHLLVEKITFGPIIPRMIFMGREIRLPGLRGIQKGDVVIFRPPDDDERDFIKRCIAVAGDVLHINDDDGHVYVNGVRVEEPYVKCPRIVGTNCTDYRSFGKRIIEGTVPPGHIVVLGDNRTNSQDSRYFGYVPIERVKGKAFILYWNTGHVIDRKREGKRRDFFFLRFGLIR